VGLCSVAILPRVGVCVKTRLFWQEWQGRWQGLGLLAGSSPKAFCREILLGKFPGGCAHRSQAVCKDRRGVR